VPRHGKPTYVGPAFDEARVHDAMRVGVIGCRPETPLPDVARMMTGYGMHAVVVWSSEGSGSAWGIVTSVDLAAAGERVESLTAGDVASREPVTVASSASLAEAARLMSEHRLSHLVVVQPDGGEPVGVVSARGVTAALAYGD
jgi:CBS domain-containing protein